MSRLRVHVMDIGPCGRMVAKVNSLAEDDPNSPIAGMPVIRPLASLCLTLCLPTCHRLLALCGGCFVRADTHAVKASGWPRNALS